jgi:hypothetical protein
MIVDFISEGSIATVAIKTAAGTIKIMADVALQGRCLILLAWT